ncbi:FtsK/SpoIIIE domain-containing protein [Streptomyces violaceusniger]|uniref:ATP-binding protein n=1 Tax=Streptomyces violaceusniger TaxID=68280 RepID=UPI0034206B0C
MTAEISPSRPLPASVGPASDQDGPRLDQFRFHRIFSVPRRATDTSEPDRRPAQLTAAVTAAHAILSLPSYEHPGLAAAWIRPAAQQPLQFVVGGHPYFPPAGRVSMTRPPDTGTQARHTLLYPPGATAESIDTAEVTAHLRGFPHWLRCTGFNDALWLDKDERSQPSPRGSFDDAVAYLPEPFAWLVIADPLPAQRLEDERSTLATRIPGLRQRQNSASDQLALERDEARYRELTRALGTGLWDVHVLVGGQHPDDAHAAAALLCGASDLDDLPYLLVPTHTPAPLDQALAATVRTRPGAGSSPFPATAELVAALARPPARELPGIRALAPNRFDVTPEPLDGDGFLLGDVLGEALAPVGHLHVSRATLVRHAFVCGATGSGKSQTVRTLLTALSVNPHPVPWLVIEPAKAEYARMAGRLGDTSRVTVIRPGDPDVAPASLNPLEPEPGFPLQSHIDLVRALFLAAFEGHEPFPQVLARALTQCYTDAGWDLITSSPRPAHKPKFYLNEPDEPRHARYPTLGDLQNTAQKVVENIGYGKEITGDVRGFVDVRIGSLRQGTPGRFFEGGHPLDIADLLAGNAVLELETITNDQDKAFLIGTVLIRIVEHHRVHHNNSTGQLRHVTVVEEAHRLLKNVDNGPAAAAVELFASLLAEIRAYGEGITIVEQIPSKLLPDVIKNSALKIMHRLPAADDRQAVGATMNLQDDQSENIVALSPGYAASASDGTDHPVLIRVPHHEDREDATGAHTTPPLQNSRSPLCGTTCREQPCTLRTMNDAAHRALEPALVVWVEAVASAQAMLLKAPDPAHNLSESFNTLPERNVDCILTYAVERAVAAREPYMRSDIDPQDFAINLRGALAYRLGRGPAPVPVDPRRLTYANYRWRDALFTIHTATQQKPDDVPHRCPESDDWAARGLVLASTTLAEQRQEILNLPCYTPELEHSNLGNVKSSGLHLAILALTGGITEANVKRAFRHACTGPAVSTLLHYIAGHTAAQCAAD